MITGNGGAASLGSEVDLWRAADALRSNMDASEYKHVVLAVCRRGNPKRPLWLLLGENWVKIVDFWPQNALYWHQSTLRIVLSDRLLGLIFFNYISGAFEEKHRDLIAWQETDYVGPEDQDEYQAVNDFWMPQETRRSTLQANARQPTIGKSSTLAAPHETLLPKLISGELRVQALGVVHQHIVPLLTDGTFNTSLRKTREPGMRFRCTCYYMLRSGSACNRYVAEIRTCFRNDVLMVPMPLRHMVDGTMS